MRLGFRGRGDREEKKTSLEEGRGNEGAKECPAEKEPFPLFTGQRPLRVPMCAVGPAKGCGPQGWRGQAAAPRYLEPQEPRPGVRRQVFRNVRVELHKVQGVGGTQNQGRHSSSAFVPCEVGTGHPPAGLMFPVPQ